MKTDKENYLIAIHHGMPEKVPQYARPVRFNLGLGDWFEKGPAGGGKDGFGCLWAADDTGPVPVPGHPVITDITRWKEQVTFPDLDAIDWKAKAEKDLAAADRETQVIEYCMGNGPFERLLDLMGIEEMVYALMDEPEACKEFLAAWTEYRLHYIDLVAEYYHPDFILTYDDVAYANGLFISVDDYREFIKPIHKQLNDHISSLGIEPLNHCCGKAEVLIEDFIEEGALAWASVEPDNDIVSLLKKYGDRICLIGGYRGNGMQLDAPDEKLIREMHRVIDTYAPYGSFIIGNHIVQGSTREETMRRLKLVRGEAARYGAEFYQKRS